MNRALDAGAIGKVGLAIADLADLAERLNHMRGDRIALGDQHPGTLAKQDFAQLAADESAAAEHGHKWWTIEWAHVLAAGCLTGASLGQDAAPGKPVGEGAQ